MLNWRFYNPVFLLFIVLGLFAQTVFALDQKSIARAQAGLVHVSGISTSLPGLERRINTGTGVVLNEQGYVGTSRHLLFHKVTAQPLDKFEINIASAHQTVQATLVWESQDHDLAILKVSTEDVALQPLSLSTLAQSSLQKGGGLWSLAYPAQLAHGSLEVSEASVVELATRSLNPAFGIKLNALIYASDTRHPGVLFNHCGQVIGFSTPWQSEQSVNRQHLSVSSVYLIEQLQARGIAHLSAQNDCKSGPTPQQKQIITPDAGGEYEFTSLTLWVVLAFIVLILILLVVLMRPKKSDKNSNRESDTYELEDEPAQGEDETANTCSKPQPIGYVVGRGRLNGLSYALYENDIIVIGRSSQSDIVLDDEHISRQHAKLGWDKANMRFWLEDLGGSNGCFVTNGQHTRQLIAGQPVYLEQGYTFYLWSEDYSFRVLSEGG